MRSCNFHVKKFENFFEKGIGPKGGAKLYHKNGADFEIQLSEKRIKEFGVNIEHKNQKLEDLDTKIDELKSHLKFKK